MDDCFMASLKPTSVAPVRATAARQELTIATVGLPAVRLLRSPATRWSASHYLPMHHICITLYI